MDVLLTLDAGTGSGRCIAFDTRGRPLASAQEAFAYESFVSADLPMLRGFDLDAAGFRDALARCARAVMRGLPAGARVRGVIATSQREGCVFIDRAGEVLYAGPNIDARSVLEGMEVEQVIGAERLHAITGHAPPYIFPVARYLWFRKHHDASRIATILMLNDWITYLLSDAKVAEHSNAGESMMYDVTTRRWSTELLEALDIPADVLPPLCAAGTHVGTVTASAATTTGIPEGTPVFAGGADTQSALLGSGVYEPGQTAAVLGTTSPVQMVTERPIIDASATLWTGAHVVADRWVLESNAGDTGGAYRWLLELAFGSSGAESHAAAEQAMAGVETSERQIFCHLGPLIFSLRDMSPFKPAGFLFRFPLLHSDRPQRGALLHAYLESVAFAIRGNCQQVAVASGRSIPRLAVSGGMTLSPTLTALIADAVGVPLDVATVPESASLGCAILAAVGVGLHATIPEAVAAMTSARRIDPDPVRRATYEERYRKWREVYDLLQTWSL